MDRACSATRSALTITRRSRRLWGYDHSDSRCSFATCPRAARCYATRRRAGIGVPSGVYSSIRRTNIHAASTQSRPSPTHEVSPKGAAKSRKRMNAMDISASLSPPYRRSCPLIAAKYLTYSSRRLKAMSTSDNASEGTAHHAISNIGPLQAPMVVLFVQASSRRSV